MVQQPKTKRLQKLEVCRMNSRRTHGGRCHIAACPLSSRPLSASRQYSAASTYAAASGSSYDGPWSSPRTAAPWVPKGVPSLGIARQGSACSTPRSA
eukprot:scaffold21197_cov127-Isochrysis_galbana.AAC.2